MPSTIMPTSGDILKSRALQKTLLLTTKNDAPTKLTLPLNGDELRPSFGAARFRACCCTSCNNATGGKPASLNAPSIRFRAAWTSASVPLTHTTWSASLRVGRGASWMDAPLRSWIRRITLPPVPRISPMERAGTDNVSVWIWRQSLLNAAAVSRSCACVPMYVTSCACFPNSNPVLPLLDMPDIQSAEATAPVRRATAAHECLERRLSLALGHK